MQALHPFPFLKLPSFHIPGHRVVSADEREHVHSVRGQQQRDAAEVAGADRGAGELQ